MNLVEDVFIIGKKYDSSVDPFDELLKNNITLVVAALEKINKKDYSTLIHLSTCNRFEIIGKGDLSAILNTLREAIPFFIKLEKIFYLKKGTQAVDHIFSMSSGLDSNILGDMEILGQFKNACVLAKKNNRICSYMERLINTCLQSSKEIRQTTNITNGTTSLSYAAIQILKNKNVKEDKSILLIGLGKFGKSIAKNLTHYFPKNRLSLANRTLEKSKSLSKELNCDYIKFEDLSSRLNDFDIIISAIGNQEEKNDQLIHAQQAKIIIDLSVPSYFSTKVKENKKVNLININEASDIINQSILDRKNSLPKATKIIDKYKEEFLEWALINEKYLKAWKKKVKKVSEDCDEFSHFEKNETKQILNKSIGEYVVYVKNHKNTFKSKELMLNFLDNKLENNCIVHKYSNKKITHNCNKCRNKYE